MHCINCNSIVSGLDPAGPFFSLQPEDRLRLDKTDATFVDIYHSNRGALGDSSHQTGDINVYINGGDNQPGCEEADTGDFAGTLANYLISELSLQFRSLYTAHRHSGKN